MDTAREIKTFLKMANDFESFIEGESDYSPYPEILPSIIHKLKNKLTPILGYSQILQMKHLDDAVRTKIDSIERNTNELTELFENLKKSLVKSGRIMETHNLNSLILDEKFFFDKIRESGINISLELDNSIPSSMFDRRLISLLIQNVVKNSVSSVKDKTNGKINISSGFDKKNIILKIRDNGIGIDDAIVNDIWTPFFSGFGGGSGIGLLVVEKALENHNGSFLLKSKIGKFTEFTFLFPLTESNSDEKVNNPTNFILVNFKENETDLIIKIFKDNNVSVHYDNKNSVRNNKTATSGTDVILIDTSAGNKKEIPGEIIENFSNSKIVFLYENKITDRMKDFMNTKNIMFVSTKSTLITTINIIEATISKEEA